MKPIPIRLEPEMRTRLDALADHNGMSVSNLVRTIIGEWLASNVHLLPPASQERQPESNEPASPAIEHRTN